MNQTQLKVFTAAAENRSFTKTAEQLFITQAAVTQHIQALGIFAGRLLLFCMFLLFPLPKAIGLPVSGQGLRQIRVVIIEQGKLAFFFEQGQIFILAVNIHEEGTNLLEDGQGHMAAVHQHHAAAAFGNLPGDD